MSSAPRPNARSRIAGSALTLTLLLVLQAAPSAHAAWSTAGVLAGPVAGGDAATGPEAGRVAVAGTTSAGALLGAAHVPGGGFGAVTPVAPGTLDTPAVIGPGGAVGGYSGDRPFVARLLADGTVTSPAFVGAPFATFVGVPAVAASGALVAVVADPDGHPRLWRQPAADATAAAFGPNLPDDASVADVEPAGPDAFLVALAAPLNDAGGVRVRAVGVAGGAAGPLVAIEQSAGEDDTVNTIRALPGPASYIAFDLERDAGSVVRLAPATGGPVQTLAATTSADAGFDDVQGVALATGGAAVAWIASDDDAVSAAYALSGPAACGPTPLPFVAVDVVDRPTGPQFVGLTADGRAALVDAACSSGVSSASEPVPGAEQISAAVDADGTLLAVVGRGDAGATTVLVDDVTPPLLGAVAVPAAVRPRTAFAVALDAFDPWSAVAVAWSVDGSEVADGARATLPGLPAGRHRVLARAANAAGLAASVERTVSVVADAPVLPTPPPAQPPAASGRVLDTTPPALSALRPTPRCLRARSGTRLRVAFRLSEAARVVLTVRRRVESPGRSRCPGPFGRNVPGTARDVGAVTVDGTAGENRARIAAGRAARRSLTVRLRGGRRSLALGHLVAGLAPGTYVLSARATDAAGNVSAEAKVKFWVLTPRRPAARLTG